MVAGPFPRAPGTFCVRAGKLVSVIAADFALKVTAFPPADAVASAMPAIIGIRRIADAWPFPSVIAEVGVTWPPGDAAKVTISPATGFPCWSVTATTRGDVSVAPGAPLCWSPLTTVTVTGEVAALVTVYVACAVNELPVSVALTVTTPLAAPAGTRTSQAYAPLETDTVKSGCPVCEILTVAPLLKPPATRCTVVPLNTVAGVAVTSGCLGVSDTFAEVVPGA